VSKRKEHTQHGNREVTVGVVDERGKSLFTQSVQQETSHKRGRRVSREKELVPFSPFFIFPSTPTL